ncbi:MAG TPA: four helix bundle protein [Gemmatimonadales bacterium]|nr:four helix bundle protein [Gemmatimonadales bacterium]
MALQRKEPIRSYQDLLVWKRAMQLLKETYVLTEQYPKRETYGITAQMRGAALSIPSNIAEGQGRPTTRDFLRFLGIASGSLRELQTYCHASVLLGFAKEAELGQIRQLADETGKLLGGLRDALQRKLSAHPKGH